MTGEWPHTMVDVRSWTNLGPAGFAAVEITCKCGHESSDVASRVEEALDGAREGWRRHHEHSYGRSDEDIAQIDLDRARNTVKCMEGSR